MLCLMPLDWWIELWAWADRLGWCVARWDNSTLRRLSHQWIDGLNLILNMLFPRPVRCSLGQQLRSVDRLQHLTQPPAI
jgi:hypothetical protein